MSIYSEYRHGYISEEEFRTASYQEESRDREVPNWKRELAVKAYYELEKMCDRCTASDAPDDSCDVCPVRGAMEYLDEKVGEYS